MLGGLFRPPVHSPCTYTDVPTTGIPRPFVGRIVFIIMFFFCFLKKNYRRTEEPRQNSLVFVGLPAERSGLPEHVDHFDAGRPRRCAFAGCRKRISVAPAMRLRLEATGTHPWSWPPVGNVRLCPYDATPAGRARKSRQKRSPAHAHYPVRRLRGIEATTWCYVT